MGCMAEYLERAFEQRQAADASDLPMVKLKHYEAAERWEKLAAEAERTEIAGQNFSPARQDMFY